MRLSISLIVLVAIVAIPACGFQTFSGSVCDGDAGLDVPCDASCHSFNNRHSFKADLFGDAHSVAMFVDAGCAGQFFNFTAQVAECTNVNTGTDIESFQCFSGSVNSASSASAPTLSMSFSSTDSSTLDPQSTASSSSAPPASASSASLSATGSSTLPASPSPNTNDGRGTRSGISGGAVAGAAVSGSVATLLLLYAALWCYKRRSRRPTAPFGDVDDPIPSAAPYSPHLPEDSPFLVYRSPMTNGTHRTAPAMLPTSPREMPAVSPSSPRSDTDVASKVALLRKQLERLNRTADHDAPPRYEDGKV